MSQSYTIEVLTQAEPTAVKSAVPAFGDSARSAAAARIQMATLDVRLINENFKDIVGKLAGAFEDSAVESAGGFKIDEIEVSLGLSAKGGFSLIGSAEIGGQTGIKVKLKRQA